MASGINELKRAFLMVSRLTIVGKCGCKIAHPFALEFSTDPLGCHRITLLRLCVISRGLAGDSSTNHQADGHFQEVRGLVNHLRGIFLIIQCNYQKVRDPLELDSGLLMVL
jgi:hypothetical protein